MKPQLANLLRLLLAMLGARLATKGWIERGSEASFADYVINFVGAVATLLSVFSAFKSVRGYIGQINTALALPAYSTPFALKQAASGGIGSGVMDYLIAQAINTVLTSLTDDLRRAKFRPLFLRLRNALNATFPEK